MKTLRMLLLLMLATSSVLAAETVRLKSGAVFVGDVELVDDGATVIIHARFPTESETVVGVEDIAPASLYWIHERRTDHDDPAGRLRLAELAAAAGLHGVAIEEYRGAQDLDPSLAKEVEKNVRELTELVAADIVTSAEDLLADGNPNAALLYLHAVEELYPRTRAAREASKLMAEAHRQLGAAADIAKDTVPQDQVQRLLDAIQKNLAKGDKAREKAVGHIGSTVAASSQRRALDQAIRYYRKSWDDAKTLPVVIRETTLRKQATELQLRAKQTLVTAYLDAASVQLQRNSITRAEEYCNAACEIDPENKKTHDTHRLIVEAKSYGF